MITNIFYLLDQVIKGLSEELRKHYVNKEYGGFFKKTIDSFSLTLF